MPIEATVMDEISQTPDELKEKLVRLTADLEEVKKHRKNVNKSLGEQIKDLEEEIRMTLELIRGDNADGQNAGS